MTQPLSKLSHVTTGMKQGTQALFLAGVGWASGAGNTPDAQAHVPPIAEPRFSDALRLAKDLPKDSPLLTPEFSKEFLLRAALGGYEIDPDDFDPDDSDFRSAVVSLMKDQTRTVRLYMTAFAGEYQIEEALEIFREYIDAKKNPDEELRRTAAHALGRLSKTSADASRVYKTDVLENNSFSTLEKMRWLWQSGQPTHDAGADIENDIDGRFGNAANGVDDQVEAALTWSMRHNPDAAQKLRFVLDRLQEMRTVLNQDNEKEVIPTDTALEIGNIFHEKLLPLPPQLQDMLIAATKSPSPWMSENAAAALSRQNSSDPKIVLAMRHMFAHPNVAVRSSVAEWAAKSSAFQTAMFADFTDMLTQPDRCSAAAKRLIAIELWPRFPRWRDEFRRHITSDDFFNLVEKK